MALFLIKTPFFNVFLEKYRHFFEEINFFEFSSSKLSTTFFFAKSTSFCFALMYSCMVPWRSKWSGRMFKIAPS